MRVGVLLLPEHPWPRAGELWRELDELGYDHGWTYDHLSWRTLRDGPWFGAVPTLAAAAAVTGRIGLGTLVATPNLRHPATLAKDVVTLDHISGGRFVAGVGAGAPGADAAVLGGAPLSAARRADRFEEFVRLLDELLTAPSVSYRGEFFTVDGASMVPGCVQRPRVPLAIAAGGPRGLRLAARYGDIWVTLGDPGAVGAADPDAAFTAVARQLDRLGTELDRISRPRDALRTLVLGGRLGAPLDDADALAAFARRYAGLGCTDFVFPYPRPSGVFAGDPGIVADLAHRHLADLRAAGS